MKPKQYRTVWVSVDDWSYLLAVGSACGLSASLLTAQSIQVVVQAFKGAGVDGLIKKAARDPLAGQVLRERIAQVLQSLLVVG